MGSTNPKNRTAPARPLPKGPSWRTLATLALVALVALVIGVTFANPIRTGLSHAANALNQKSNLGDHAGHAESDQTRYTCGMHPWVILPAPGDCPICHMKLVPVDENKFTDKITIDPAITQRIGVRTTQAVMAPAHRTIQTTGVITWDESALYEITLKYTGWIEKLHVDTVGQPVKKGELLFEIYAPAVYVAQEEYLTLWRRIKNTGDNNSPTDSRLLIAAKRRLLFLDVTPEQITELEARGSSQKTIGVYSPADGYVVERNITQGSSVSMNSPLYRIADISKIWVMAAVYEQDLTLVSPDMKATMTLPYAPGKKYQGSLSYIYPYLDTASRQATARLVFDNPEHFLKPGMFAQVNLQADIKGDRLIIPRSAVVDTGKRQVVFVAQGQGNFEPRTLTLGANVQDNLVEVLTGIEAGEKVVTQGQFLLDSESNMRQNLAQMTSPESEASKANGKGQDTPKRVLSSKNAASLNAFIDVYLAMSDQLAADENDLSANAKILADRASALPNHPMPSRADFWQNHDQTTQIAKLAGALSKSQPLPQTREQFLKISNAALTLLRATGLPPGRDKPVQQIECAMYQHNLQGESIPAGGQWITPTGEVRNPYFGAMMLGCYTDEAKLPIAAMQNDDANAEASDQAKPQAPVATPHKDHP